jgi:hypothetical protein
MIRGRKAEVSEVSENSRLGDGGSGEAEVAVVVLVCSSDGVELIVWMTGKLRLRMGTSWLAMLGERVRDGVYVWERKSV